MVELDRRPWPAFHFAMTGAFTSTRGEEKPRFWKLEICAENGLRLP